MARNREPDYDDEDEVPWLSEVEEERPQSTLVSQRRLIGGIALFLGLLALIVGGIYAITSGGREGGSSTEVAANPEDVPLIAADPGPYKVRPEEPGGMQVDGAGDTMFAAGTGADPGGAIDAGALPEDPMPRPGDAATGEPRELLPNAGASEQVVIPPAGSPPQPRPVPTSRPAPPVAVASAPPPLQRLPKPVAPVAGAQLAPRPSGSAALQLGAFSSSAKADAAWKDYTARFAYLAGLGKSVARVERDGATLYRLRAVGVADRATANDLCGRMKVAGEACLVTE